MTLPTDPTTLISDIQSRLAGNQHPIPFSLSYEKPEGGGENMVWAVYIEAEAPGKPRYDLITQHPDMVGALRSALHRLQRELFW